MRTLTFSILTIMFLATAAAEEERERIATLIGRLGADEYQERHEATEELIKIGLPALPALEAARKSDDAEVRLRAERACKQILTDNHVFDGLKVTLRSDKNEYPEGATIALTLEIANISGRDKEITIYDDDIVRYSDIGPRYEKQSSSHGIIRIEQIATAERLKTAVRQSKRLERLGKRAATIRDDETITKPYVIKTAYDSCVIETQESEEEESDEDRDLVQPLNPGTYEITCYLSRNEKPLGIGTVRDFPVSPNRPAENEDNVKRRDFEKIEIAPVYEYTTEDEELCSNTITIKILPGEPSEKDEETEE